MYVFSDPSFFIMSFQIRVMGEQEPIPVLAGRKIGYHSTVGVKLPSLNFFKSQSRSDPDNAIKNKKGPEILKEDTGYMLRYLDVIYRNKFNFSFLFTDGNVWIRGNTIHRMPDSYICVPLFS